MVRYFFLCAVALSLVHIAQAQQNSATNAGAWSGVIIRSDCTIDEAFAESEKCTTPGSNAKLALYDDNIRQIYGLDPQDQVTAHLADSVIVHGTLDRSVIHVLSINTLRSFGLAVRKRPNFRYSTSMAGSKLSQR